jgi:hypothetical protein
MFVLFIWETTAINEELTFIESIATYKLKLFFFIFNTRWFLIHIAFIYFIKYVNLSIKSTEVTFGGTFHLYNIPLNIWPADIKHPQTSSLKI